MREPRVRRGSSRLGYLVLAATAAAYLIVYSSSLGHPPTSFDYLSLLNTTLPLVFVAIGQSLVVITGGIDLSVGGIVSLCVAVTATTVDGAGADAVAAGCWSWSRSARRAARSTAPSWRRAGSRRSSPRSPRCPSSAGWRCGCCRCRAADPAGRAQVLTNPNVPTGLIWLGLAIAGWLVLRRTRFGMRVYAIGSDETSARAVGVPVAPVKVGVYALSGLCSGLAAVFYVSTTTSGDANAGAPFILTSIASVVVGGIAFSGGRGSALGAMAGAMALTLVIDVLFFAGIDPLYQSLFQGLFLVVAVLLGTGAALIARLRRAAMTTRAS